MTIIEWVFQPDPEDMYYPLFYTTESEGKRIRTEIGRRKARIGKLVESLRAADGDEWDRLYERIESQFTEFREWLEGMSDNDGNADTLEPAWDTVLDYEKAFDDIREKPRIVRVKR